MSSTVLYMSMSLDGFIAGPNESPDNGLGDGGERLHEWIFAGAPSEHRGRAAARLRGRQPAGDGRGHGHRRGGRRPRHLRAGGRLGRRPPRRRARLHPQPHRPPAEAAGWPRSPTCADLETRVARAKQAAGDKNVLVHGATVAQLALAAGVLDEIQIHLVPVLLGEGRRLFEHLGADQRRAGAGPGPRRCERRHPPALPGRPLSVALTQVDHCATPSRAHSMGGTESLGSRTGARSRVEEPWPRLRHPPPTPPASRSTTSGSTIG